MTDRTTTMRRRLDVDECDEVFSTYQDAKARLN